MNGDESGVEVAVDYREPGWAVRVSEAVGAVDVVFDGVGGDVGESAFGLLDRGGQMVRLGMASGEWARMWDEAAWRGWSRRRRELSPRTLWPGRRQAGCDR